MRTPDETTSTLSTARASPARGRLAAGELVLDRYRLMRRIGAGGFGVVWSAYDERLEREVAVKIVPREDAADSSARVDREALAAARLNHPGIVSLYELASDADDHFLVSELVPGATLAELGKGGAVSDRDVARIGGAICDALAHAHGRGVVHRDVKPGNVMVLAEPAAGSGFAKLTDFGIAHLAGGADGLTATGDVVGTLAYMAPEQADGLAVSGASDVYALALTLYEAWTGANPVRGPTPAATARRVGRPLPSLGARRPELPGDLCDAIDDALEADPGLRPTPQELGSILSEALDGLDEDGGLVERETQERFGITAARTRRLLTRRPQPLRRGGELPGRALVARIGPRLFAGAAAGALIYGALELFSGQTLAYAPYCALAAAAATMLVPRIGWLGCVAGLCAWLAATGPADPGSAAVLAATALATVLLLPRAGHLWSLPALAPLLGLLGLAPLFVGLAALAAGTLRRAGLAVAGMLWLIAAELLSGRRLLFGAADRVDPRGQWTGSVPDAAREAVWPLISTPELAPAGVWLVVAALLGLALRGRYVALDLLVAAVSAAGLVAGLGAVGDVIGVAPAVVRADGVIAGSVLGAVVAAVVGLLRPTAPDEPPDAALP